MFHVEQLIKGGFMKYKKGQQTAVYNSNSGLWQVQTRDSNSWRFFNCVPKHEIEKEKRRQLAIINSEN